MGDEEKHNPSDGTYGLPAILIRFDTILNTESMGIQEHQRRSFEAHAMLSAIDRSFVFIPFKSHAASPT